MTDPDTCEDCRREDERHEAVLLERLALFIAHRSDGRQWSIDCPEWVRDRYREAARLAWQHVINPAAEAEAQR